MLGFSVLLPSARRFFAPTPFQSHSSQHGGLTGAGGRTPRGIWLHQGNSINPPAYGRSEPLRILILVDHVFVEAFIHQFVYLGLLPCLAEGGKILSGIAIKHQFIVN